MLKQLIKRLSHEYRHQDYYKWIGPEDGQNPDGTRKGVHHFIYTCSWYNGLIDWIMIDVLDMDYAYNRTGRFGWGKVWRFDRLFD